MDVDADDFLQIAVSFAVVGVELGDDGEGFAGVDGVGGHVSEEVVGAEAVRVQVAAVFVANARVPSVLTIAALGASAEVRATGVDLARVSSVSLSLRVGLPNVKFEAARAHFPVTVFPSFDICISVDKFDVMRALRVAVTRPSRRTGLVCRVFGHSSVSVHFYKIESAVQATRQVGDVNVNGELLVQ